MPGKLIYTSAFGDVVFAPTVLARFDQHRQRRAWSREAGGQLFGTLATGVVRVEVATGPRRRDRRGRWFYWPRRHIEQNEIVEHFRNGLHYLGDWHTHYEEQPAPSGPDVDKIQEIFRASDHDLRALLLIVVGRLNPPQGLWVGMTDGRELRKLVPRVG